MGSYADCGQVRLIIKTVSEHLEVLCTTKESDSLKCGGQAVEIIAGRLTFLAVRSFEAFNSSQDVQSALRYCIDRELVSRVTIAKSSQPRAPGHFGLSTH